MLEIKCLKHFIINFTITRKLMGRNFINPCDLSSEEIKTLLWTAFDLKHIFSKKTFKLDVINGSRITLLLNKPCLQIQTSAMSAANYLECQLNVMVHQKWDNWIYVNDIGRIISTCSDMILCTSKYRSKITCIAEAAHIPVICLQSCAFAPLIALSSLMAIQHKHKQLNGLTLALIGKPCPLVNTFMSMAPNLGINVQYLCCCSRGVNMSPSALPIGKKYCLEMKTCLKECKNILDVIADVNVIAMTSYSIKDHQITLDMVEKYANDKWSFLHVLPRGLHEVDSDLFDHKNSLVWESKENLQWIFAAIMVQFLSSYKHITERPIFDNTAK